MVVEDIVRKLDASPERDVPFFKKLLQEVHIGADWIREHTPNPIPLTGYQRDLLYHGSNFELVLATWSPRGETLIHDHGSSDSFGMVRVLRGKVFNHIYKVNGEGVLGPKNRHVFAADGLIPVPKGLIHLMGNTSGEDYAMSLHLYSPVITGVCYWDPESLQPAEL